MSTVIYRSPGFLNHYEYRKRTIDFPLQYDASHFVVTRYFQGGVYSFVPTPLNTVDDEFGTAFLISPPPNIAQRDGEIISYEMKYATIPASIPDYSSTSVVYPALNEDRAAFTQSVTCKIARDYFLVGPGLAYTTAGQIPYTRAMQVTYPTYPGNQQFPILGGGSFALNDGGGVLQPSTPSLTAWGALIAADDATGDSFSVQSADSALKRYMGNIWERSAPFAKAQ